MKAIISDIHANIEALCEVMKDIEERRADEIVCLGDIVGYGPDPEPCVDFIMEKTAFCLKGNHDYALVNGTLGFNPLAAEMIKITREIMEPAEEDKTQPSDGSQRVRCACRTPDQMPRCLYMEHAVSNRWRFIRDLQESKRAGPVLYVHASPLDPVFEYVLPDRFKFGWRPDRLKAMFQKIDRIAFCGHTHHPCVIDSDLKCFYPAPGEAGMALSPEKKYIINAGSTGQPRDGDNRACYLLYDETDDSVEWRRVPYDFRKTAEKIEAMCGKGNFCATRLKSGK